MNRETVVSVLIALSVVIALMVDAGLERRTQRTVAQAESHSEPLGSAAIDLVSDRRDASPRTGLTSLTNP